MSEMTNSLVANSMPLNSAEAMPAAASVPGSLAESAQSVNDFNNLFLEQWLASQLTPLPASAQTSTNPTATPTANLISGTTSDGKSLPPVNLLTAMQGKALPLQDGFINLDQITQQAMKQKMPIEGVMHAKLAIQNPVAANDLSSETAKLFETAELSKQFNELTSSAHKPLNLLAQTQLVLPQDNSLPTQAIPTVSLSQSVSTYSSQAHLPPITASLDQPQAAQDLNDRIQWMINSNVQKADMKLEPAELGTLEVRVTVTKDQANVTFHVSNAQAKDAIESAIPRLREMFNESGVQLGNVDVSQQSFSQHADRDAEAHDEQPVKITQENSENTADTVLTTPVRLTGNPSALVDYYT